jgi:hypothetical protein
VAVLGAPLDPVTVASLKGTLDYYLWRGIPVVRSWPRKPMMPRAPAVTEAYLTFGAVARAITQVPLELQDEVKAYAKLTNWTWRDWWTAALYGNMWEPFFTPYATEIPDMPAMIPGRYYTTPSLDFAPSTASNALNILRLVPIYVPTLTNFDRIAWEVTATTGGNDRVGVYGPLGIDPTLAPLLLDAGNFAIGSTGVKEDVISLELLPGWYLLALVASATRTYRTIPNGSYTPGLGYTSPGNFRAGHAITKALTFGALPNPLGGSLTYDNTNTTPLLWLRAS